MIPTHDQEIEKQAHPENFALEESEETQEKSVCCNDVMFFGQCLCCGADGRTGEWPR